jgi:acyl-coenzyme A thioesterase PaaI-like protein
MSETAARFHAEQAGALPDFSRIGVERGTSGRSTRTLQNLQPAHGAKRISSGRNSCRPCRHSIWVWLQNIFAVRCLWFTTAELKANFVSTAREGNILCRAHSLHEGRTTQPWDAEVVSELSGKTIALFRCTQIILYERSAM